MFPDFHIKTVFRVSVNSMYTAMRRYFAVIGMDVIK